MIKFVQRDSAEWNYMWRAFEPNTSEEHPLNGEVWQYMGTVKTDSYPGWAHEFRHRMHPVTGKREYRRVPASIGFKP